MCWGLPGSRGLRPRRVGLLHVAPGGEHGVAGGRLTQVGLGKFAPEAGGAAQGDDIGPGGEGVGRVEQVLGGGRGGAGDEGSGLEVVDGGVQDDLVHADVHDLADADVHLGVLHRRDHVHHRVAEDAFGQVADHHLVAQEEGDFAVPDGQAAVEDVHRQVLVRGDGVEQFLRVPRAGRGGVLGENGHGGAPLEGVEWCGAGRAVGACSARRPPWAVRRAGSLRAGALAMRPARSESRGPRTARPASSVEELGGRLLQQGRVGGRVVAECEGLVRESREPVARPGTAPVMGSRPKTSG